MHQQFTTICSTLCLLLPMACSKTEPPPARTESIVTSAASARPAEVGVAVPEGTAHTSPSRTLLPPNPATVGATLGRTFQGELVADVTLPGKAQAATFRYATSGDRLRMRLEGSPKDFDLLAEGKTLKILDHKQKTYRNLDLTSVKDKPIADKATRPEDLEATANEKIVTSQAGLRCEERKISGEQTDIQACVSALPGSFERGVFEQATGIAIPAWLASLIDDEEIPLRAKGRQPGTPGEFSVVVTRFSAEVLSEEAFAVPTGYTEAK